MKYELTPEDEKYLDKVDDAHAFALALLKDCDDNYEKTRAGVAELSVMILGQAIRRP